MYDARCKYMNALVKYSTYHYLLWCVTINICTGIQCVTINIYTVIRCSYSAMLISISYT
jgi:hypothetical protein